MPDASRPRKSRANTGLSSEMATNSYPSIMPAADRYDMLGAYHLMPPPLRRDSGESVHVPLAALAAIEAFA
jgi:hypothetical protein